MSSSLSKTLRGVLPADTATSWVTLRDVLPESMVLYGGTAIAVHLRHRVSRDLDFFFDDDTVDLQALRERLSSFRPTAVTHQDSDTLNAIFGDTKVQFLRTRGQTNLEPPTRIEGLRVAGLRDLLATKLKVIADRGELRDYFDIKVIDQQTPLKVETGLADYQRRFHDTNPNNLAAIVRGLGYLGDVVDDPGIPTPRHVIESYWASRQARLLRSLDTTGAIQEPPAFPPSDSDPPAQEATAMTASSEGASSPHPHRPATGATFGGDGKVWVPPHLRNGRHVKGYWRRT
ncbi:MAG: nucleotidyl transferase AbiEii/AbiGii toxin family protein [Actinomycetes bacterium]